MQISPFYIGLACIIAAIIGGGLKAGGIEFPPLKSLRRQLILASLGGLLIFTDKGGWEIVKQALLNLSVEEYPVGRLKELGLRAPGEAMSSVSTEVGDLGEWVKAGKYSFLTYSNNVFGFPVVVSHVFNADDALMLSRLHFKTVAVERSDISDLERLKYSGDSECREKAGEISRKLVERMSVSFKPIVIDEWNEVGAPIDVQEVAREEFAELCGGRQCKVTAAARQGDAVYRFRNDQVLSVGYVFTMQRIQDYEPSDSDSGVYMVFLDTRDILIQECVINIVGGAPFDPVGSYGGAS